MLSLYIASPPGDEATETKIKSDRDTGDVESGITHYNHVIMHGFDDSSSLYYYYNSTRVMNVHKKPCACTPSQSIKQGMTKC